MFLLTQVFLLIAITTACTHSPAHPPTHAAITTFTSSKRNDTTTTTPTIPLSAREYWIHQANTLVLVHPCPFAAFGSVIVNHTTANPQGELICTGANQNSQTGNPTLHGEMAAINNCSSIFISSAYNMTPADCPMCAAAVRWAGLREYVYGVSIKELIELGWGQLDIGSEEVIGSGVGMRDQVPEVLLGGISNEESRALFAWQFGVGDCPEGCERRLSEGVIELRLTTCCLPG
ncbi:cytidine deaminase-like protein [Triangularia setosa]|uniref:Cytidine deaminase-like protein n=1 Tax=Triangularia setosa TaxID=2587417 RepID=A0AAN6W4U9_9PEZI|nr:cytidine deaminase-like protein [Podospora setosa]